MFVRLRKVLFHVKCLIQNDFLHGICWAPCACVNLRSVRVAPSFCRNNQTEANRNDGCQCRCRARIRLVRNRWTRRWSCTAPAFAAAEVRICTTQRRWCLRRRPLSTLNRKSVIAPPLRDHQMYASHWDSILAQSLGRTLLPSTMLYTQ
eukprot:SAG31_NODE_19698_length_594_cov_0.886869_1_plen_148_part_10